MGTSGNSNQITRQYLDSLLLETRYLDTDNPSTAFSLYGADFQTPIMTGALSHLGEEMGLSLARGAKEAGAVFWYGMAEESEIQQTLSYPSVPLR